MKQQTDHLVHNFLEARDLPGKNGKGLFATQNITKGETLIVTGGRAVTRATLEEYPEAEKHRALQIGDEIFLIQHAYEEGDCINHSCDANAGFVGQICIVAMRDIWAGEEVCIDYAMADLSNFDEFECHCGARDCRGFVTGKDWSLKAVQKKYAGFFTPHVQRMIDQHP